MKLFMSRFAIYTIGDFLCGIGILYLQYRQGKHLQQIAKSEIEDDEAPKITSLSLYHQSSTSYMSKLIKRQFSDNTFNTGNMPPLQTSRPNSKSINSSNETAGTEHNFRKFLKD